MTELLIVPDFARKTARFRGAVAAGEKVNVTVCGGKAVRSDTLRLRLCASHTGETLAVFQPQTDGAGSVADPWGVSGDDATCTISLNTVQMRLHAHWLGSGCAVTAVLDDPGLETVHAIGTMDVIGWSGERGDDGPYDLSGFPGLIDGWTRRMDAMVLSAVKSGGTVTISAWDGRGEMPPPVTLKDGESAYEVARRNGFEGTESQWLASLKVSDAQVAEMKADIAENRSRIISADNMASANANHILETKGYLDATQMSLDSHVNLRDNPHQVTASQVGALAHNGKLSWGAGNATLGVQTSLTLPSDSATKGVLTNFVNNDWQGPDGAYPKDAREEVQGMIDAAVGDVNAALEGVA